MSILGCPFVADDKTLQWFLSLNKELPAKVPLAFTEAVEIIYTWHKSGAAASGKHWRVTVSGHQLFLQSQYEGPILVLNQLLPKSSEKNGLQLSVKCTCRHR